MTSPDTAVIPCGGLGTRMRPITRWLPKELLPVSLSPLIHWALAEAAGAGLSRAIVVTNPGKPILGEVARAFAGPPGFRIELVSQDRPAGLGDALLRARDIIGERPFAVVLPDNLFRGPNQTAAVLTAWDQHALAAVLIAEISAGEAGSKGATGRARMHEEPDGTLRVLDLADKGLRAVRHRRRRPSRHADRPSRAPEPAPGASWTTSGARLAPAWSWTTCPCCSGWRDAVRWWACAAPPSSSMSGCPRGIGRRWPGSRPAAVRRVATRQNPEPRPSGAPDPPPARIAADTLSVSACNHRFNPHLMPYLRKRSRLAYLLPVGASPHRSAGCTADAEPRARGQDSA